MSRSGLSTIEDVRTGIAANTLSPEAAQRIIDGMLFQDERKVGLLPKAVATVALTVSGVTALGSTIASAAEATQAYPVHTLEYASGRNGSDAQITAETSAGTQLSSLAFGSTKSARGRSGTAAVRFSSSSTSTSKLPKVNLNDIELTASVQTALPEAAPAAQYTENSSVLGKTGVTVGQLTYALNQMHGGTESPLAQMIVNAEQQYNINAFYIAAAAAVESTWNTSYYSTTRNNDFGINADTDDPNLAYTYPSQQADMDSFCQLLTDHYLYPGGEYYNGDTLHEIYLHYSTSDTPQNEEEGVAEDETIASIMNTLSNYAAQAPGETATPPAAATTEPTTTPTTVTPPTTVAPPAATTTPTTTPPAETAPTTTVPPAETTPAPAAATTTTTAPKVSAASHEAPPHETAKPATPANSGETNQAQNPASGLAGALLEGSGDTQTPSLSSGTASSPDTNPTPAPAATGLAAGALGQGETTVTASGASSGEQSPSVGIETTSTQQNEQAENSLASALSSSNDPTTEQPAITTTSKSESTTPITGTHKAGATAPAAAGTTGTTVPSTENQPSHTQDTAPVTPNADSSTPSTNNAAASAPSSANLAGALELSIASSTTPAAASGEQTPAAATATAVSGEQSESSTPIIPSADTTPSSVPAKAATTPEATAPAATTVNPADTAPSASSPDLAGALEQAVLTSATPAAGSGEQTPAAASTPAASGQSGETGTTTPATNGQSAEASATPSIPATPSSTTPETTVATVIPADTAPSASSPDLAGALATATAPPAAASGEQTPAATTTPVASGQTGEAGAATPTGETTASSTPITSTVTAPAASTPNLTATAPSASSPDLAGALEKAVTTPTAPPAAVSGEQAPTATTATTAPAASGEQSSQTQASENKLATALGNTTTPAGEQPSTTTTPTPVATSTPEATTPTTTPEAETTTPSAASSTETSIPAATSQPTQTPDTAPATPTTTTVPTPTTTTPTTTPTTTAPPVTAPVAAAPTPAESAAASGDTSLTDSTVVYSQYDPRWAGDTYGNGTIAEGGCGITTDAEIISTLSGQTVTPDQTAAWADAHGGFIDGEGSSWQVVLVDEPEAFGLQSQEISSEAQMIQTLQDGGLVSIAGTGSAPFTSEGHILALRGYNASTGEFLVADPNSPMSDVGNLQNEFTYAQLRASGMAGAFAVTK
jgi:hypothetical protein